jgi:uncharacterized protein YgbK (DUF1537 family)
MHFWSDLLVKVGVVADDLTGANDTGVQFSKVGLETLVLWNLCQVYNMLKKADVVVVDTETRFAKAEAVYSKVLTATRRLRESGVTLFYKKMDSMLRGNICAEVGGMIDALEEPIVLVAPAFPSHGRTTVGGH